MDTAEEIVHIALHVENFMASLAAACSVPAGSHAAANTLESTEGLWVNAQEEAPYTPLEQTTIRESTTRIPLFYHGMSSWRKVKNPSKDAHLRRICYPWSKVRHR